MAKVRVSTDSTADVPQELREELGIPVLPITVQVEGKEYRDGVDITPTQFYEILEHCDQIPTSAQVTVARYTGLFEETLAAGYTHLIHVSINSKGSGTYQAGVMAKEMFFEEHPELVGKFDIQIVDSRNYSMAYGLAVVLGARAAKEGKEPEAVMAAIRDYLDHGRAIAVPMTLKFVKKSGRVSPAAAFLGDAMGLKPLITFIDGEAEIPSKIRGESKVIPALAEEFKRTRQPGKPYAVASAGDPALREALAKACLEATGEAPLVTYELGCAIAINIGPNAAAICYYHV